YKGGGGRPPGSHKPNTAVAQAYENAQAGIKKLTTETGAGQWGSSLAFACSLFGLECEVWMVGSSYDQKPYRRSMMETWGATVHRSPSDLTNAGRAQQHHPTGSLGIAISEAVEIAAGAADADVHARPRLRPAARARRRPAIPRRLADGLRARQGRCRRGPRLQAERDLRSRRALRPHRGHHPRARARARDPRGDRGGRGG